MTYANTLNQWVDERIASHGPVPMVVIHAQARKIDPAYYTERTYDAHKAPYCTFRFYDGSTVSFVDDDEA